MCPLGCLITVTEDASGFTHSTKCKNGIKYAEKEITAPERMVTSLIPHISLGVVIPCKTSDLVPKNLIFDILKQIKKGTNAKNIKIGDILITNVCNTGTNIVATANLEVRG
jgi:CxxC motif-containing protein